MQSSIDTYKIVVLGQGRVGKTSISLKYARGQFHEDQQSTINAVYLQKNQKIENGKSIKFALWDTAGQQKYNAIVPVYYRDAVGAIIVYQITSTQSFNKVKKWILELKEYARKDIVLCVCGNKSDMQSQRRVNHKEADLYAKSHGASHYLVSAKSGAGITQMFYEFGSNIYKLKNTMKFPERRNKRGSILGEQTPQKKFKKSQKKSCC